MQLSMWIIANRLEFLEPELHLTEHGSQNLLSARLKYAQDCVYVYDSGNDAVCRNEDDYFILREMDALQALDIVQSVFDFFNDLEREFQEAERQMDLQSIVDNCQFLLHNPLMLQDANHMILAMSQQYSNDEVSPEWNYCAEHGHVSVNSVRYMHQTAPARSFYQTDDVQYCSYPVEEHIPFLTSLIVKDNIRYGRVSVHEHSRKLNFGDVQVLRYVSEIFQRMLPQLHFLRGNPWSCNLFADLLQGNAPDLRQLQLQYQYFGWAPDERFHLAVTQPAENKSDQLPFAVRRIRETFPAAHTMTFGENVVTFLPNGIYDVNMICGRLQQLCRKYRLITGLSLQLGELSQLRFFYAQAVYTMSRTAPGTLGRFYTYAYNFILEESQLDTQLCACHPSLRALYRSGTREDLQALHTLLAYLAVDCSPSHAARELQIPLNTLKYRIGKILQRLEAEGVDMEDSYVRDYMLLSLRVLYLKNPALPAD
jgi:hypothetical protein